MLQTWHTFKCSWVTQYHINVLLAGCFHFYNIWVIFLFFLMRVNSKSKTTKFGGKKWQSLVGGNHGMVLTFTHEHEWVACDLITINWLLARTLSLDVSCSDMERPWRDVCQRVMQSVPHTETAQTAYGCVGKEMDKREKGGSERKIPQQAATKFSFSQITSHLPCMCKIC